MGPPSTNKSGRKATGGDEGWYQGGAPPASYTPGEGFSGNNLKGARHPFNIGVGACRGRGRGPPSPPIIVGALTRLL
jgi:hypothetical protein